MLPGDKIKYGSKWFIISKFVPPLVPQLSVGEHKYHKSNPETSENMCSDILY